LNPNGCVREIRVKPVGYSITGDFAFVLGHFWFTSGLLLLILLSLIDQPHFSKDSNVFLNAVTAGVSLLLVSETQRDGLFWLFFFATAYLLISSYFLLWWRQRPLPDENAFVALVSRANREVGKPEALFSAFFLWGAYLQFGTATPQFNALLMFWVIFIILNIPALARTLEATLAKSKEPTKLGVLGEIFGVQSKNTFLVKLFDDSVRTTNASVFDFVEFCYSTDGQTRRGLILDIYLLNQEQWIKVLSTKQIDRIFAESEPVLNPGLDVVYKIDDVPANNLLETLVGVVTENSRIEYVRFIYNSKITVSEGQLLAIDVNGVRVLYQIVEGITRIETLEQKNQTGLIVGEAVQLGTWDARKQQFEPFGWVPNINAPVFIAPDIEEPSTDEGEYVIGRIPRTNYPVTLNKTVALSHHMAVVGVTGTGKSVFSRNLIRQHLADEDIKVICVDFTGEYAEKFADLAPVPTIQPAVADMLFKEIDEIERIIGANYNRDNDESKSKKREVSAAIYQDLEAFLSGDSKLSIFELPHVENTSGVLTYTKTFFRVLFHIAKTKGNFGNRICLVLEEAHTVVPEWNFSGIAERSSQALLNSIAQIALQGRKYDVGLLVIAQRTANVSKTILTQCNTIVSFQEFDKTSSDFLANYFGQDLVASLPKLKNRQAIAAGKAFRSNIPMIFEVPELPDA